MPDETTGDVSVAATTSDAGEIGNVDSTASQELSDAATQELASDASSSQEQSQTKEQTTESQDPPEPENIKQVRDWGKGLERDIKTKFAPAYSGLEKAASELFGTATAEDVQATIQTVQAAAPLLKVVLDANASSADVVSALQKALPSEHMESVAWAALNDPATQEVIFSDPEVLQTISEKLFDGKTIEEVQAILANAPATEVDPEKETWRKEQADFKSERQREASEKMQLAAQTRSQELMTRFFEAPAQTVIADDFKLIAPEGASEADKQLFADTAEDIRYAAQGRFLKANMDAYMQIDNLYKQGKGLQAQAAEIRLQNKYHATLIKVAERNANLLNSRSVATVGDQQTKINAVRPDVTGSVDGTRVQKEAPYDVDSPDFMRRFTSDVNPNSAFHN